MMEIIIKISLSRYFFFIWEYNIFEMEMQTNVLKNENFLHFFGLILLNQLYL